MKEKFNSANSKDFAQRYQGTYGWWPMKDGSKLFIYINLIDKNTAYFNNADGKKYEAWADQDNEFEFQPVERGLYNDQEDRVLWVRRVPATQWQRGISAKNTSVVNLESGRTLSVGFSTLVPVLEPKTPITVDDWLSGNRKSYAFNRRFGVIQDKSVVVYDSKIGDFDRSTYTIKLKDDLYLQEMLDMKRDLRLYDVRVVL